MSHSVSQSIIGMFVYNYKSYALQHYMYVHLNCCQSSGRGVISHIIDKSLLHTSTTDFTCYFLPFSTASVIEPDLNGGKGFCCHFCDFYLTLTFMWPTCSIKFFIAVLFYMFKVCFLCLSIPVTFI